MAKHIIYHDDGIWYVMRDGVIKKMFTTKAEAEKLLDSLENSTEIGSSYRIEDDLFWPGEFDGGRD